MPELPEVETVVRALAPQLQDAVFGEARVDWPKILDGMSLGEFNRQARGRRVRDTRRRGKYICIVLDDGYLVVHLRMTGRLYLCPEARGRDAWVHFSLALGEKGYLIFSDARKFGRVTLTPSLNYLEEKLGPEPLLLEPRDFKIILTGSSRAVKTFLLDQKKLAGVGNIYADEALHRSGIHPERPIDSLGKREKTRLGKHLQEILREAIEHEGSTISWYRKPDGSRGESQKHFRVYGRLDEPCLRCGTAIQKKVVGRRGTHYCPKCQK